MTEDDIKALREALEAGPTEGPWRVGATDPLLFGVPRGNGSEPLGFVYGPSHGENSDYGRRALATCAYIAAASPDRIARLLDALKAEQDEVYRLQASHSALYAEVERLRAAQTDQTEPVAWMTPGQDLHLHNAEGFRFSDWTPLYTAPPQRVPLKDEQIKALLDGAVRLPPGWRDFARAIERAHGIGGSND